VLGNLVLGIGFPAVPVFPVRHYFMQSKGPTSVLTGWILVRLFCRFSASAGWQVDILGATDHRTGSLSFSSGLIGAVLSFQPHITMDVVAAVDIGGHNLRGILADLSGQEIVRTSGTTNREALRADENVEAVAALVQRLLAQAGFTSKDLACLSLGVPGVVDIRAGQVLLVPNVPHWNGLHLGAALQSRLGRIPVRMDNDVNLAAFGEYWRGSGKGCSSLFFIAIGTGIGGGIVIDGRIYRGTRFGAGEIGYFVMSRNQRERRFGEFGWFESVASGYALDRAGRELARKSPSTLLRSLARAAGEVRSRHVFEAAAQGDQEAKVLVDEALDYMALAVVNITALLDPEVIVLGGGVSNQGDHILIPIPAWCLEICRSSS
jgi:glucokinase